jgi:apolipoprotein N-acyltransferase
MVVCPKEVNTPRGIFFRESLSDQLIRNLTAHVQTFSGFTYHTQSSPWDIARKFVFWLGIISILVGFFWIDSSIDLSITGWVNNIVLIILVIVEVFAIYFWSSILG